MELSLVEGRGEVGVGKDVSNHYKSGFFFLYPYLFTLSLLIKLKIYCCTKSF